MHNYLPCDHRTQSSLPLEDESFPKDCDKYGSRDLLIPYFSPLVGENSISNFEVLNDKNSNIGYSHQFFYHLCEHLEQKSLTSHIIEFIGNDELNMWNQD